MIHDSDVLQSEMEVNSLLQNTLPTSNSRQPVLYIRPMRESWLRGVKFCKKLVCPNSPHRGIWKNRKRSVDAENKRLLAVSLCSCRSCYLHELKTEYVHSRCASMQQPKTIPESRSPASIPNHHQLSQEPEHLFSRQQSCLSSGT